MILLIFHDLIEYVYWSLDQGSHDASIVAQDVHATITELCVQLRCSSTDTLETPQKARDIFKLDILSSHHMRSVYSVLVLSYLLKCLKSLYHRTNLQHIHVHRQMYAGTPLYRFCSWKLPKSSTSPCLPFCLWWILVMFLFFHIFSHLSASLHIFPHLSTCFHIFIWMLRALQWPSDFPWKRCAKTRQVARNFQRLRGTVVLCHLLTPRHCHEKLFPNA